MTELSGQQSTRSMSNVTRKSNDTDTDIVVDPLLWFIDKLKDQSNRQDLNKVMLAFYKEETILASKICLHEKLNKPGDQRLKRYKGPDAGKTLRIFGFYLITWLITRLT